MSRSRWVTLAAVLVVLVVGWSWWRSRAPGERPRYRTTAVERGAIESRVSATGTIRPVVQVEVGSQVSGTVDRIGADYNSRVRAGQVLCQLEPSSFRARLVQAQATVARAEAALKDGKRQLARAQELIKDNYVSQADVDAADVAVEQRQADLQQARAQLEAAQVDLDHATIRAPIDGVVISRSIDVGQTVAASLQAPTLFVLANDLTRMQVETRIDESDIGQIRPGLPVSFTVDAFPDETFEGRVAQVRLEPIVEQGVVTYTTVIHTGNPDLKLRPGMTANVSVLVEQREDVLKIPAAALRFRPPVSARKGKGRESTPASTAPAGGTASAGAALAARGAAADSMRGALRNGGPTVGGRASERWARGTGGGASGAAQRGRQARKGTGAAAGAAGTGAPAGEASVAPAYRAGMVYVLRDGKPAPIPVLTGLSDGTSVEVKSERIQEGDAVIVALEVQTTQSNLQPPPGMGGSQFRGAGRAGGSRR